MSLIWKKVSRIGSLVPTGGTRRDVGDIEYLNAIAFGAIPGGTLRVNSGSVGAGGGTVNIDILVDPGFDGYLAEARFTGVGTGGAGTSNAVGVLLLNAVVLDTISIAVLTDTAFTHKFSTHGQKLVAGDTFTLRITAGASILITGDLSIVQVPTGTSPILPQAGAGGGNNLFGESTTLFPSLERAALDVSVFEFDLKGAFFAVVVQDGRIVDNSTRTNQDAPIGWSVAAQTDAIDNNISNGIEDLFAGSFSNEMRHDWGSVASRTVTVVDQLRTTSNQPGATVTMRISFSDDNITYGATTVFHSFSASSPVTQESTFTFTPTSFRFTKIEAGVSTPANTGGGTVREIYDRTLSGGKTFLTFEVFDNERGDWKSLLLEIPIPAINPIEVGDTVVRTDQIGEGQINQLVMPTATAGGMRLIRAVLTTTQEGVSDTSVVLLKTNTLV